MSDIPYRLDASPVLPAPAPSLPGASIAEVANLALVSVAAPHGGRDRLDAALQEAWGAALPAAGRLTRGRDDVRLLGVGPDQALAMLPQPEGLAVDAVAERLGADAYLTEQTDAWVVLRLAGPAARPALERLCPVDLDASAFAEDTVARTVMEHLGAIVLRDGDGFLLLSARSSAGSFLHALETSVRNVAA